MHTFQLRGDRLKEVFERAVNDVSQANKVFPKFDLQLSGEFRVILYLSLLHFKSLDLFTLYRRTSRL